MFVMVDVEADGPCPGEYSMICLGAVAVEDPIRNQFYGRFRPVCERWMPEALSVSGFSREETMAFPEPGQSMKEFSEWLGKMKRKESDQLGFISDNNGFDWQFVNYYFWRYLGKNPFGHSSTNLGSLYKGVVRDFYKSFKHLRETRHDHNPVNDARGNAEAFIRIIKEHGMKGVL